PGAAAHTDRVARVARPEGGPAPRARRLPLLRDDRQGRPHRVREDERSVQRTRGRKPPERRGVTVLPRRGAAVLGSPISHSWSPVLHAAAYDALGLDDWRYAAVECDEAALPSTLQRLDAEGLAGVSLTMPLKRAVMPL